MKVLKWIKEWWIVFIVPAISIYLLYWALTQSGAERTTISAPIQFCKSQYTGRSKTEDIPYQTCVSIDSKGMCSSYITNWSSETRNEVRVTCDWIEWQ